MRFIKETRTLTDNKRKFLREPKANFNKFNLLIKDTKRFELKTNPFLKILCSLVMEVWSKYKQSSPHHYYLSLLT